VRSARSPRQSAPSAALGRCRGIQLDTIVQSERHLAVGERPRPCARMSVTLPPGDPRQEQPGCPLPDAVAAAQI